jgi:hypothetical protein
MRFYSIFPILLLVSQPINAQNPLGDINLRCVDPKNGFALAITIKNQKVWIESRETQSVFTDTYVQFIDPSLPDYTHVIDRVTGRLTVYKSGNTYDSHYFCSENNKRLF